MLTATGLGKSYGTGPRRIDAVSDLSLEVPAGEFLAIVGRSGSGKSTLLGMLGGLSRPTAGSVQFDGTDVWALGDGSRTDLRSRKIGFVFQFASLLPTLRAVDNIALPALIGGTLSAEAAYARAESLLARVGLGHRAEAYPGELSGGEQRRVALARALINSPPLLLADEPTADLDEDTEAEMLDLLLDVRRSENLTLIVVTHNAGIASRADRVVEVRQGRLVAASVPEVPARLAERASSRVSLAPAAETEPAAPVPVAAAVRLGQGLRRFLGAFVAWALLVILVMLALNQGTAVYQQKQIDEKGQARKALEDAALSKLQADIQDVAAGRDRSFELTLYLANATADEPIYVMTPTVRAYVQVGMAWQEVPLRPADSQDGRVLKVAGKQEYRYVFEPDVKKFEELMPGYMHVRFTNTMLVSQRSEPTDDLVERTDSYYVYLKLAGADDEAITKQLKFPGKPPLWIPMPPH